MILYALALSTALAQEPQTFQPLIVDHTDADGIVYRGILVDEYTFSELGELRLQARSLRSELSAFEDWKRDHEVLFTTTLDKLQAEHASGQAALTQHYEEALLKAQRRDKWQRHSFAVGVAVGVIGAAALTVGVFHFYDKTLPDAALGRF